MNYKMLNKKFIDILYSKNKKLYIGESDEDNYILTDSYISWVLPKNELMLNDEKIKYANLSSLLEEPNVLYMKAEDTGRMQVVNEKTMKIFKTYNDNEIYVNNEMLKDFKGSNMNYEISVNESILRILEDNKVVGYVMCYKVIK